MYRCGVFDTMENKLVLFEPGCYKFKMLIVTPPGNHQENN